MNFKKTILMAIIAIIAVTVLVFDTSRLEKEKATKEAESRLIAPAKEKITELTIHQGGKTTQLVKQGTQWRLAQPVQVRADDAAVTGLLDEIDRAKRADAFDPQGKLADFGLATPGVKIEVKAAGSNYIQEVALGGKTTDGTEVYAQLAKDPKIFTVPDALLTQLTKPVKELRDKRLLPANLNEATSVALDFGGKKVELGKHGADWNLLGPIKGGADNDRVGDLLRGMNEVKAADFIDTHPLNLAKMGLDKPALKATVTALGAETTAPMTLLVGGDVPAAPGHVYAMRQGGNYAFTITQDDVNKMKPALDDLRSKKIFAMADDQVGRMIVDMRGSRIDVKADSAGKWALTGENPAAPTRLDQARLGQLKTDLLALKATKFLDAKTTPSETGLDLPFLRLTLASKDGKSTQTLATGHTAKDGDVIYARLDGNPQLLGINTNEPKKFFLSADQIVDKSMFNFDETLVKKVQVRDGAKTITFTAQPSGAWAAKPEGAAKEFQVEGPKMMSLIYSVSSLNWTKRLDPRVPTEKTLIEQNKVDKPTREIVMLDEAGKELARLGQAEGKDNTTYVLRGGKDHFSIAGMTYAPVKNALDEVLKATEPKK